MRNKKINVVAILVMLFCMTDCHTNKKSKTEPVAERSKHKAPDNPAVPSRNPLLQELARIGVSKGELSESKLYSFIQNWYGVPYRYGGCQKSGVDCSCFANLLYESVYNKRISRSSGEIYNLCDKISLDEAREGDLLFFKIGGSSISHVGVYLRKKFFIHSSTSRGVIINSVEEAYYKKYFFCAGKMKSI